MKQIRQKLISPIVDIVESLIRDSVLDFLVFQWELQIRYYQYKTTEYISINQFTGSFLLNIYKFLHHKILNSKKKTTFFNKKFLTCKVNKLIKKCGLFSGTFSFNKLLNDCVSWYCFYFQN